MTRADLDGLVAAVLITCMEPVKEIVPIHLQDITDGKFGKSLARENRRPQVKSPATSEEATNKFATQSYRKNKVDLGVPRTLCAFAMESFLAVNYKHPLV